MNEQLQHNTFRRRSRGLRLGAVVLLAAILGLALIGLPLLHPQSAPRAEGADGDLVVTVNAGYNLVVDSNVSSPSTYAPRVATVIGKFCNTTGSALTNVWGYIGNGTIPGTYPQRNSLSDAEFQTGQKWNYLYNTGLYAFRHVGAVSDASRFIGTIPAHECRYQYWTLQYPACENVGGLWKEPPCTGDPVWGSSIKPEDDLSLQFVIWGTSDQDSDSAAWTMTMRNEISAMANKIEPNGNPAGRWFNVQADEVEVGDVITTNGILYSLGNVRFGFDNNGDYVPDYNGWVQPISQADFDPTCFRLIRTSGVLTITAGGGETTIWPFEESLYFTGFPADNTNVRGEVYYTFLALNGPCSTALSPYQEVASGYDNEKFNGDYGAGLPVASNPPKVGLAKTGTPSSVSPGDTSASDVVYTIPFTNTGTRPAGLTLASGFGVTLPLAIRDTVPTGMLYIGGSAANNNVNPTGCTSNCYTIYYSTDGGNSWSTGDPGNKESTAANPVVIAWWLNNPLPAGGSGTVRFTARVPSTYSGPSFIENDACIGLGDAAPFACDDAWTMVKGTGSIGDYVWRDENNNGQQDDGATGINGVAVSLYWDRNGDGQLDDGDVLMSTQDTYTSGNAGYYQFTQLPAANYLVVVDKTDAQIPTGYRLTTPGFYAVTLASGGSYQTADFGFGPSLSIEKRMVSAGASGCDAYEGQEVVYSIALTNERPGTGESYEGNCRYYDWSSTGSTASPPKNFTSYADAFGEPDNLYASGDFAIGSNRWIRGTGFNPGGSGTISSVEAVFRIYVNPGLSNDFATARLYQGGTQLGFVDFTTGQLNAFTGPANAGYLTWNLAGITPPGGPWTWDDFALLTLHLEPQKNGGADPSVLYIDAMGFRVTASGACPVLDLNDIMTTVPLTDTYNTTYLQFVSADPPHTSVDTGNGLITWSNVGPIYPGETRVVTVRFLALPIAGTSSATVNNSAGSTGTRFADGGYANNASDTASGTICQTGSINGYVFSDLGTEGWNYAPGTDWPIPGIPVTIYGCYHATEGYLITNPGTNKTCAQEGGEWRAVSTQTTGTDGYYAFNGLLNGYYYVQVGAASLPGTVVQTAEANDNQAATGTLPNTTASGHTCGQPGGTCDSTWGNYTARLDTQFNPIDSAGETINGVNFGYRINPGVYGSVWEDNNGDGDKDPGEGPIGSVTVWLYNTSDCSGTPIATTTTDANGRYQFGNLTAGNTYCIAVDTTSLPSSFNWTQTGESDGSINNRITFTAVAGTLSGSHDFGFRKTGSYTLGDTLYYDWDGDGTQDGNEEGIPDVTVQLYEDVNGNGIIDPEDAFIASTATNGSGFYEFTNLAAGSYLVLVATDDPDFPAGVVQTQDPDESGVCLICNNRGLAALGPSDDTVDFGYQPRGVGSIGDTVYRDMNGDGVQGGPTETGIANITVWLEVDLNGDGTYARVASAVTDADGKYLFENLPDATYRVVVDDADADLPEDPYGHPYAPSTPTTTDPIAISGGNTYLDADFGFQPLGAIGDRVWQDNNGNGNQDIGEPGIAGVTVGLYTWTDVDGDGVYNAITDTLSATPLATDVTDADGLYLFSGLPAGNYVVKVDSGIPSGYNQSGDPDWLEPCTGSGLCDGASGVNLRVGQIDMSRDFGYRPTGVIGDYIWFDNDGDGLQDDGEQGIGYVTVRLCADVDCNSVLATTQTDSDGYYTFGNLSGTSYYVQVDSSTLPAGLTPTYDLDGTGTPHVTAVTLPQGGSNLTADFGYRYAGDYTISGFTFFDVENNGGLYITGTDTPYANITVYLWKDGAIIGTATTDAYGYYAFTGLPNGNYAVSVDPNSPQLAGLTQNTPTPQPYYQPVTINNANVYHRDFGYYAAVDYGDLPDSYRTYVGSAGAGHILGGPRLGSTITAEANGQPTAAADGDSDDGVALGARQTWTAGSTVDLNVTVTGNNGYLVGFFDWNGDGSFGAGEMVVFGSVPAGNNALTVDVPSTPPGSYIYTRFRLYDSAAMTTIAAFGLARGGEVEDYRWPIGPLAVKLLYFTAAGRPGHITLAWETASEEDNAGFNLYRRQAGTASYDRVNAALIRSQVPPGQGYGASYTFLDTDVVAGVTYEYMLEDVDWNGMRSTHGPAVATVPYTFFFPLITK